MHLRLPALNRPTMPAADFSLPPIAPLMHQPSHSSTPNLGLGSHCHSLSMPPGPLPKHPSWDAHLFNQAQTSLAPIQGSAWPLQNQSPHHTYSMQGMEEPKTQIIRPARKRATLADLCKAVVGSLFNPFRLCMGGCNPKYAHKLCHNNWTC